jgi:diguanylate cyclase (GGDEF)-like protein
MDFARWMVGNRVDRERLLDMEARLRPMRRRTFAVLGLGLVACAPWAGWWTLAPMAGAIAVYWVIERLVAHVQHPGVLFFAAWVTVEAIIASSVALTGQLREATVCLLAIPVMTLNARFSSRGIILGGVLAAAAMAAVLVGADPAAVAKEPPILVAPVMLVVAWGMLSTPLMRSDIEHRRGTRIDPLTGMLNRNALSSRVADLSQQSAVSGGTVAVIHGDIDLFKAVNDEHGHQAGDDVLKDVAYVLRAHIRAFESAYRLGGEEFLILLAGADLDRAVEQAERLRAAIERGTFGDGHRVTMSFGVAASREGEVFDFDAVFAVADRSLYRAKHTGRNRVCGPTPQGGSGARRRTRPVPAEAV